MLSCIALYRYVSASLPCVLFDCSVCALRLCFLSRVAFDTLVRSVCAVFVISYVWVLCIALCSIVTLARAVLCIV